MADPHTAVLVLGLALFALIVLAGAVAVASGGLERAARGDLRPLLAVYGGYVLIATAYLAWSYAAGTLWFAWLFVLAGLWPATVLTARAVQAAWRVRRLRRWLEETERAIARAERDRR